MGKTRFTRLMEMLPCDSTVLGLDEKTALMIDPCEGKCYVFGLGNVTLIHTGHNHRRPSNPTLNDTDLPGIASLRESHIHQYHNKEGFPLAEIGPFRPYHPEANLPVEVWQQALEAEKRLGSSFTPEPPQAVLDLVILREQARTGKDWPRSDALRQQIAALGWTVKDTKDGPLVSLSQTTTEI